MTIENDETVVMAFAKFRGSYYTLAAHPFRPDENGLLCLGRAKDGGATDLYGRGIEGEALADWHGETLALLNDNAAEGTHAVLEGDDEKGAEDGAVRPLDSPWYAVFSYNPAGKPDGGSLWVGRFFGGESAPVLEADDAGVYVVTVGDAAEDAGGEPKMTAAKADRSVVIASRPKSQAGVQKSAEHGPGVSGSGRRIQW